MSHECTASCTAGWSNGRKCHCRGCGQNFSTPSNFDKHFDRRGEKLACLSGDAAGLVKNKYGVLIQPGEVDFDERFKRETKTP